MLPDMNIELRPFNLEDAASVQHDSSDSLELEALKAS